jgi:hypothetical protein
MTYCLSLHCQEGLVFFSDTRTSAGVDNVTTHSKMRVYEVKGQRVLCLLTSGNLSVTQSVTAYIDRDLEKAKENPNLHCLLNQADLFARSGAWTLKPSIEQGSASTATLFWAVRLASSPLRFTRFIRRETPFIRVASRHFCRSAS